MGKYISNKQRWNVHRFRWGRWNTCGVAENLYCTGGVGTCFLAVLHAFYCNEIYKESALRRCGSILLISRNIRSARSVNACFWLTAMLLLRLKIRALRLYRDGGAVITSQCRTRWFYGGHLRFYGISLCTQPLNDTYRLLLMCSMKFYSCKRLSNGKIRFFAVCLCALRDICHPKKRQNFLHKVRFLLFSHLSPLCGLIYQESADLNSCFV